MPARSEIADTSSGLKRFVPLLEWLPKYDRSALGFDLIAGLTLWGLVVPEAMAYAGIAGLPPQAGLYTLIASMLIYALFGTSRHLSMGGTSAAAALLASSVAAVVAASAAANASDPTMYPVYAAAFVLVLGVVFLAAGFARVGYITQFLSKPVMEGFVVGIAAFVAVGQLYKLFGVPRPSGNTIEKLAETLRGLPEANWTTFAVGAGSLALLFLLPRLSKKLPAGLVVLFGAIALSSALDLAGTYGVEVVGTLPGGLPSVSLPMVPLADYLGMVLPAIGVLLVVFSESLGTANEFATKHGYEVDADQELTAHAFANIGSALFGGMIVGGSMSASAVKEGAGARTQVANLITWVATVVTVLFLTPLFATLPEAVLGALIIHAVWHILASRKLLKLRREAPVEVWFGVAAMAGVLFIDVLQGMLIGVLASLVFVIYRTSKPHVSSLGRVPGVAGAYSDMERHPENEPVPGILIVRPDTQLYYANAQTFKNRVRDMVEQAPSPPDTVIIDASAMDEIDFTTTEMLAQLIGQLRTKGIEVYLADVHAPVLEEIERAGLLDEMGGSEHVCATIDMAINRIQAKRQEGQDHE